MPEVTVLKMTITDKAPPPHRTQIPNIVDDLGLDPYERALYVHYKRVCGENQGAYCFEATKTTAQKVKMSTGQVSEARRNLANRGLIIVQDGRPIVVTVINVWELNTQFYHLEHRPDIDGWTIEQIKLWLCDMSNDVHTVNVTSHNDIDTRSPDERNQTEDKADVHTVNERSYSERHPDDMSNDVHTVKQRIESMNHTDSSNKRESTRPKSKSQKPVTIPAFKIFVEITDFYAITKYWQTEAGRIVGDKPEDLEFWRRVVIGWTGKYPTKHNIQGMLDYYQRREIPGYQSNGASRNGHKPTNQQPAAIPTDPAEQARLKRMFEAANAERGVDSS